MGLETWGNLNRNIMPGAFWVKAGVIRFHGSRKIEINHPSPILFSLWPDAKGLTGCHSAEGHTK